MSPQVGELLDRFDPSAVVLFPPVPADDMRLTEQRIDFTLPPSLKSFLSFSNGMKISFGSFFGIASASGRTLAYGSIAGI